MPTVTKSEGTTKYTEFEERRYTVRVKTVMDTTSPPPDSRPQCEWRWLLDGTREHETGDPIEVRSWTSTVWNDTPGKESHLVLVAQAIYGQAITFEDWEALSFDDLAGQRATAMVTLNPKGYPTIDKTTFRPVKEQAAPQPQRAAAPAAAPLAPTDEALTDVTRQKIGRLIAASDEDETTVAAHCERQYGARDWATLTEAQGRQFVGELVAGELVPF